MVQCQATTWLQCLYCHSIAPTLPHTTWHKTSKFQLPPASGWPLFDCCIFCHRRWCHCTLYQWKTSNSTTTSFATQQYHFTLAPNPTTSFWMTTATRFHMTTIWFSLLATQNHHSTMPLHIVLNFAATPASRWPPFDCSFFTEDGATVTVQFYALSGCTKVKLNNATVHSHSISPPASRWQPPPDSGQWPFVFPCGHTKPTTQQCHFT